MGLKKLELLAAVSFQVNSFGLVVKDQANGNFQVITFYQESPLELFKPLSEKTLDLSKFEGKSIVGSRFRHGRNELVFSDGTTAYIYQNMRDSSIIVEQRYHPDSKVDLRRSGQTREFLGSTPYTVDGETRNVDWFVNTSTKRIEYRYPKGMRSVGLVYRKLPEEHTLPSVILFVPMICQGLPLVK